MGLTEAPPWVVKAGPPGAGAAEAAGVEVALVRAFARSLNADIDWVWGATADHMEALGRYDLDLAIGGYTADNAWAAHVGTTEPYLTEGWRIASPPGTGAPASDDAVRGRAVAVPRSGRIAERVRGHGAVPVPSDHPWGESGLIAGPAWRLAALGRDTAGIRLLERRRVMAVPPGENAFLASLERALKEADVDARLAEAAAHTGAP